MSNDPKTTKAIGALINYRDLLKQQAESILEPALRELEEAKAKAHNAKITYNQLMKKSQSVQECITIEMQLLYDEEKALEEAYTVRSTNGLKELFKEQLNHSNGRNQDGE